MLITILIVFEVKVCRKYFTVLVFKRKGKFTKIVKHILTILGKLVIFKNV